MNRPIPPDIIARFGYLHDHRYRGNGEHSSACPQCGGERGGSDPSDRFRFWERNGQAVNFWCRRCGFQGFTDDNQPGRVLTAEERQELAEMRQREARREEQRLQEKIRELQRLSYWEGWHDAMTQQQRQLWRDAGIPDSFQDYWQLGHTEYRGDGWKSPALTIPYFERDWQAQTIQYRLLNPPAPADKYRFQAGLRAGVWRAEPDVEIKGAVLLCEGMKKAAVTFIEIVARAGRRYVVVAVPSKSPGEALLDYLREADPLYIVLDPDAYTGPNSAVRRLVKLMPGTPKRIVKLPVKADDFFQLGGSSYDFEAHLKLARRVA